MGLKDCVLIVEDDDLLQESLWNLLEDLGYLVCGAADTADKAVALATRHDAMVVLMDVRLRGERDGIDAAREIHKQTGTPIVFLTGSNDTTTLQRIYQEHPAAVLIKPADPHQLDSVLSEIEKNLHAE